MLIGKKQKLSLTSSVTRTITGAPPPDPDPGGRGSRTVIEDRPPSSPFTGVGHRLGGDDSLNTLLAHSRGSDLRAASASRELRRRGYLRYKGRWYPFRNIPKTHLRNLLRKMRGTPEALEQRDAVTVAERFLDAHDAERRALEGHSFGDDWQWTVEDMPLEDLCILAERNLGAASGEVRRELRRRLPGTYGRVEERPLDGYDEIQLMLTLSFLKTLEENDRREREEEQQARNKLILLAIRLSSACRYLPGLTNFHKEVELLKVKIYKTDARQACAQDLYYYEWRLNQLRALYLDLWAETRCILFAKKKYTVKSSLQLISDMLVSGSTNLRINRQRREELQSRYGQLIKNRELEIDELGGELMIVVQSVNELLIDVEQCLPKEQRKEAPLPPPPKVELLGMHMGCEVYGCIYWDKITRTLAGSMLTVHQISVYERCMRSGVLTAGDTGHDCVKPEGDKQWVVKVSWRTGNNEGVDNLISPCAIEKREPVSGGPDKIILIFDFLVSRH